MRSRWYLPAGAAGYVLASIVISDWATSIGALLMGVGWFFLGREKGDAVMMIAGVLLISSAAGGMAISPALAPLSEAPEGGIILTVTLLGFAFLLGVFLEVVCLFRSSRASGLFRWAAYVRVVSIAVALIGVAYAAVSAVAVLSNMTPAQLENMTPEELSSLAESYAWPVEAAVAVSIAANLLAAGGFVSLWRRAAGGVGEVETGEGGISL